MAPPAEPVSDGQLCLLVLGMHRSGTSAVTRVLSLIGAALPRDILGANLGNDTGHWEPATLGDLNERTLQSVDRSWYDCRPLERPFAPDFEPTLAYEISWQYRGFSPFVLKDPRVCLLVPSYERALDSIGARALHVFILRNPMATSASMAKRDNMSAIHAQWLWLRYLLESEAATRGKPRIFVRYDDVMADWRTALAGVAELAGMNLPGPQSLESRQIEEFLSPAQRHHQSAPIDTRSQLGKWLADVEEGLGALVRSATDPAVAARLDQIHAALDAATLDADFDPQGADIPLRSLRTGGAR